MDTVKSLAGLRVVDFTWIAAGPLGTRILANFGAQVIEVESRAHMDSLRYDLRPRGIDQREHQRDLCAGQPGETVRKPGPQPGRGPRPCPSADRDGGIWSRTTSAPGHSSAWVWATLSLRARVDKGVASFGPKHGSRLYSLRCTTAPAFSTRRVGRPAWGTLLVKRRPSESVACEAIDH